MSTHPFCLAPWVHSFRGVDGFRSLCCISTSHNADPPAFAEWWNGEEMRAARRTLLAGQIPSQCQACVDSNRAAGEGYNTSFTKRYGAQLPRILASTDATGATAFRPLTMDYRTSHCNLRCRTCEARHSSSIRAESARHGSPVPAQAARVDSEWWLDGGVLDSVESIYWAGGEPFMSPIHGRAMRGLMDTGRAGRVAVHYTSNLMHLDDRLLADLADYSQQFHSLAIGASIDGLGAIGEYVRAGWKQDAFMQHLALIQAHAPRISVYFDHTITNVGLLGLPELLLEAAARSIGLQCKLMEANGVNDFLHVDLLQPRVVSDVLARCAALALPPSLRHVVTTVRQLLIRRYRPRGMTRAHAALLATSELRRGGAGFFTKQVGTSLNPPSPD